MTIVGIPCIPGSGVKGLFLRVCNLQQQQLYCGTQEQQGVLRFHGAYPVGNWSGKHSVTIPNKGETTRETVYSILDVVHPQQNRQVQKEETTTAIASISFYKPKFVFRFSSRDLNINWEEVEQLFKQALTLGLGGKTSTGYGFSGVPSYTKSPSALHIPLEGSGVSSVMLTTDLELRPNMFKASLRGHITRLFAGICDSQNRVNQAVERLFGSTSGEGLVKIFWEQSQYTANATGRNPTYTCRGNLHIDTRETEGELIKQVMQFAYIMGGFGKTWRRASHEKFYREYHNNKFAIGCHWSCSDSNFITVHDANELKAFLNDLSQLCQTYLQINTPKPLNSWRESWHQNNVKVYTKVVNNSEAIRLFHDSEFKTIPAIGGRKPGGSRPEYVTHVWHRLLPIPGKKDQYLEIVTIFQGNDQRLWNKSKSDFEQALVAKGLTLTWGN